MNFYLSKVVWVFKLGMDSFQTCKVSRKIYCDSFELIIWKPSIFSFLQKNKKAHARARIACKRKVLQKISQILKPFPFIFFLEKYVKIENERKQILTQARDKKKDIFLQSFT